MIVIGEGADMYHVLRYHGNEEVNVGASEVQSAGVGSSIMTGRVSDRAL